MAAQSGIRHQPRTFGESRSYQLGYEEGFDRGTRAGVAADRLWWFAAGATLGAMLAVLAPHIR